jgi:hypothetical protein
VLSESCSANWRLDRIAGFVEGRSVGREDGLEKVLTEDTSVAGVVAVGRLGGLGNVLGFIFIHRIAGDDGTPRSGWDGVVRRVAHGNGNGIGQCTELGRVAVKALVVGCSEVELVVVIYIVGVEGKERRVIGNGKDRYWRV